MRIAKKTLSNSDRVYCITEEMTREEAENEVERLVEVGWSRDSLKLIKFIGDGNNE